MKEKFQNYRFNDSTMWLINQANAIVQEYMAKGHRLTLRQLYYQLVARNLIENKQREYKRLGTAVSKARKAGIIDWSGIVDRTRFKRKNPHWSSPSSVIDSARASFSLDKWTNQEHYLEVWIEKDALIGVIAPVCEELDVPYFSCRGYVSDSLVYQSAKTCYRKHLIYDKQPVIIHLGDHDPSGIDMTRDIDQRLYTYGKGIDIEVRRIALTMDQVEEEQPPPNFAKLSDTRARDYIALYGRNSWELDALNPDYLDNLIRETILEYRDEDAYEEVMEEEATHLTELEMLADNYSLAIELLRQEGV